MLPGGGWPAPLTAYPKMLVPLSDPPREEVGFGGQINPTQLAPA